MTEAPIKQVRLSRAWELPNAIAEIVMDIFMAEFASGEIVAYGLRVSNDGGQKTESRVPIKSPLDYIIDWTGTRPRVGDHAVVARRREKRRPIEAFFEIERGSSTDIFEDLTIAKPDWERLCNAARKWVREWINMVFADLHSAPADLRVLAPPFDDVELSGQNALLGHTMAGDPRPMGRRGRKLGSGVIDDESSLYEMLQLLATERTTAVLDAARQVAGKKSSHSHSIPSAVDRLRKKFSERFRTEPDTGKSWADVLAEFEASSNVGD